MNHPAIHKAARYHVANESHLARCAAASQQKVVRNYLFRVFEKLGISSRVELVLYCLQQRQPFPAALPN
jgi:DNA-binding NarL/FixJ family response regulator